MKVICKNCNNLINEDEAIKMNVAEFKEWKQHLDLIVNGFGVPSEGGFIIISKDDYNIYTQICQTCWDKSQNSVRLSL